MGARRLQKDASEGSKRLSEALGKLQKDTRGRFQKAPKVPKGPKARFRDVLELNLNVLGLDMDGLIWTGYVL